MTAAGALLDLLRGDVRPAPALTEDVWDRVAALAIREQAPLVLAAVRARGGAPAPDVALTALAREVRRNAARAQAAYEQLAAVLRRFRAAGVPVALIKGAALAQFVYEDPAVRPFHDLDLFISGADRAAAQRALGDGGYTPVPAGQLEAADEQVYCDPAWRGLPIDVHWRLDALPLRLGLDGDAMLRRARPAAIGGEPVLVFAPADAAVALAAHFTKHLWRSRPRVRYLRDIAELARRVDVEWMRVAAAAAAAPLMRSPLRLALSAAVRLLGAPVPQELLDGLAPSRGRGAARRLEDRVVRRIVRRDSPAAALVQVAVMRWLDGDAPSVYGRLTAAVLTVQARRFVAAVLGVHSRRARQAVRPGIGGTVDV
jgi:hypothetical protein